MKVLSCVFISECSLTYFLSVNGDGSLSLAVVPHSCLSASVGLVVAYCRGS